MRLTKVLDRVRPRAASVQSLTEREVRRRRRFFDRTASTALDHLIRRERVSTLTAVLDPISQRADTPLRLDVKRFDELDPFTLLGRRLRRNDAVEEFGPPRMGRLGRAHDHARFVDPDTARHIDDPETSVDDVRHIDERRMRRSRFRDPRTGGVASARVERDRDDLEALRP
jgi:hypothetical protein